jgi:hypothetical protein
MAVCALLCQVCPGWTWLASCSCRGCARQRHGTRTISVPARGWTGDGGDSRPRRARAAQPMQKEEAGRGAEDVSAPRLRLGWQNVRRPRGTGYGGAREGRGSSGVDVMPTKGRLPVWAVTLCLTPPRSIRTRALSLPSCHSPGSAAHRCARLSGAFF